MATTIPLDDSGARDAAVPSIDSLIGDSIGEPERAGATMLDDLHTHLGAASSATDGAGLELDLDDDREDVLDEMVPSRPRRKGRRRKKKSTRGRGRPRKPAAAETDVADLDGRSAPEVGETDAPTPTKRLKADLEADVERLTAQLDALRAQHAPETLTDLAQSIALAAILGFGYVGEVRGNHWGLTETESQRIGESGARALAPYTSKIPPGMLPMLTFAGVLGKTIYDRIAIDRQLVAQLESKR